MAPRLQINKIFLPISIILERLAGGCSCLQYNRSVVVGGVRENWALAALSTITVDPMQEAEKKKKKHPQQPKKTIKNYSGICHNFSRRFIALSNFFRRNNTQRTSYSYAHPAIHPSIQPSLPV